MGGLFDLVGSLQFLIATSSIIIRQGALPINPHCSAQVLNGLSVSTNVVLQSPSGRVRIRDDVTCRRNDKPVQVRSNAVWLKTGRFVAVQYSLCIALIERIIRSSA